MHKYPSWLHGLRYPQPQPWCSPHRFTPHLIKPARYGCATSHYIAWTYQWHQLVAGTSSTTWQLGGTSAFLGEINAIHYLEAMPTVLIFLNLMNKDWMRYDHDITPNSSTNYAVYFFQVFPQAAFKERFSWLPEAQKRPCWKGLATKFV